jgi:hypothetical protein
LPYHIFRAFTYTISTYCSTGTACIESGITIQGEKQRRGNRSRGDRLQFHDNDDPEMVAIEMDRSDSEEEMDIENPNEF